MLKLSDAIVKRIEYLMHEKGIVSNWQLYKNSGVHKSTINALMRRDSKYPELGTLQNLCDGLGVTIKDFFNDSVFEETYHEDDEV